MDMSEPPVHPDTPHLPAAGNESVTLPGIRDPDAALTALAALYQGEKTDSAYIFNTAMALMGIAVAYLVFAIPSVGTLSRTPHGWVFLILLPVPLWLIAAFHSLITLNSMNHGVSVQIIEDQLFDASELRVRRDLVGSAAGDKIMDISKSKLIHVLTTAFVYIGVAVLIMGFTYYAVYSASEVRGPVVGEAPAVIVLAAAITYVLLLLMVGLSWLFGVRMIGNSRHEVSQHVKRFGRPRNKHSGLPPGHLPGSAILEVSPSPICGTAEKE